MAPKMVSWPHGLQSDYRSADLQSRCMAQVSFVCLVSTKFRLFYLKIKINTNEIIAELPQAHSNELLDVDVVIINPKNKTKKPQSTNQEINVSTGNNNASANIVNSDETEQIEEIQLKYGASHVIKLFLPVTLCILFVIISLSLITSYQKSGGANL